MTFEERLDRIAEKHEALTQTVELLAHMQRENEVAHRKNEVLLGHVLESVDSLARIAHLDERRISDSEGGVS